MWAHQVRAQPLKECRPPRLGWVPPLSPLVLRQWVAPVSHDCEQVQEWHPQGSSTEVSWPGEEQETSQNAPRAVSVQRQVSRSSQTIGQDGIQASICILQSRVRKNISCLCVCPVVAAGCMLCSARLSRVWCMVGFDHMNRGLSKSRGS